jgi:hypothetical protein
MTIDEAMAVLAAAKFERPVLDAVVVLMDAASAGRLDRDRLDYLDGLDAEQLDGLVVEYWDGASSFRVVIDRWVDAS